jgi:hypothetical protein
MRSVERWLFTAPTASAIARQQVAATLAEWRLEGLVDDAQVVTGELTANAVTASTGPGVDPDDRFLRFIGLRLSDRGRRLVIEIFDAAPGTPTLRPTDVLAESGRGLHLVAALATWDSYKTATGPGKVVRAVFDLHVPREEGPTVPGSLPRRSPAAPEATPIQGHDLALLHRVRQGLLTLTPAAGSRSR